MLSDAARATVVDITNAYRPDEGDGAAFDATLRTLLELLTVDLPPGSWAQHATAGFILLSVAELALLWSHADQDSSVPSTAAYVIHFTASCPPELQHLAAAYTLVNFRDCYAGLALETPFTLIDFDYTFDGSAVCGRLYFDEFLKPVYEWAVLRCQAFDGGEFTFHGDLPSCSWGLPIQEFAGGGYRTALENLLGLTRSLSGEDARNDDDDFHS